MGPLKRDVWEAAKADDVEALASLLSEDGGCAVDEKDDTGRTALHVAASSGCEKVTRFLVHYGANLDEQDAESGWAPLHRALFHGHLKVALLLLRGGATLGDEVTTARRSGFRPSDGGMLKSSSAAATKHQRVVDKDGHTPLSLLSWKLRGYLRQALREGRGGDIYTFGKADLQLGYCLPNVSDVVRPRRVDTLAHMEVVDCAAAKHHSVALTRQGHVYTWGHGRGGRLGHGDENPRMFPVRVDALLGQRVVKVSCGENHTMVLTEEGAVWTWGSDRFGQLGMGGLGDKTQRVVLVARRVEALRKVVVKDISAGAMHSAVIASQGEVYTWGRNKEGQLGYEGESNSPRHVTLLYHGGKEPRRAIQISAGPRCTLVVVAASTEAVRNSSLVPAVNKVFQWGHGSHLPVRVDFSQGRKKFGTDGWGLAGSGGRVNIIQVAAALHHNVALSSSGLVMVWGLGADQLGLGSSSVESAASWASPQVVGGMGSDRAVSLSVSSGSTFVCTETGDLYSWGSTDGQGVLGHGGQSWQPVPKRVQGLKRVVKVASGPEHTVVLLAPSIPSLPHQARFEVVNAEADSATEEVVEEQSSLDADDSFGCDSPVPPEVPHCTYEPLSLKELCERRLASYVDCKNCACMLAHAEALDAPALTEFCATFISRNTDAVLSYAKERDLEFLLEDGTDDVSISLQSTIAFEPAEHVQEDNWDAESMRRKGVTAMMAKMEKGREPTLEEVLKLERSLKKKVAQIEELEKLRAQVGAEGLSSEQLHKLTRREYLEKELVILQPLIGRARIMEAAKMLREQRAEQVQTQAEADADVGGTSTDLASTASEVPVSLSLEGMLTAAAGMAEEAEKPPESYFCEACCCRCASAFAWQEHLNGRRHLKRVANLKVERLSAAPVQQVETLPTRVPSPTADKREERDPEVAGPPSSSPWSTNRSVGQEAVSTPRKSLREILEEEERQHASMQGRSRSGSFSIGSPGMPSKLTFAVSPQPSTPSAADDTPSTPLVWLSKSGTRYAAGVGPRIDASITLSAFMPNAVGDTPKASQSPKPTTTSTPNSGSKWGGWGSASASVSTPTPDISKTKQRQVSAPSISSLTSPSRTLEDIMKEEEAKAALDKRFSGNTCPWFMERRDRSDSFEAIQTQQQIQADMEAAKKLAEEEKRRERARRRQERRANAKTKEGKEGGQQRTTSEGDKKQPGARKGAGTKAPEGGDVDAGAEGAQHEGVPQKQGQSRRRVQKPNGGSEKDQGESGAAPPAGEAEAAQVKRSRPRRRRKEGDKREAMAGGDAAIGGANCAPVDHAGASISEPTKKGARPPESLVTGSNSHNIDVVR